ncbi:MAG: DUF1640 domain-containing protein [Magnetococcales bacterium]|nr:DUF1640 domain-containing protein [Magnetococcales bacterium]
MTVATFDTLDLVESLESSGFTKEQSKGMVNAFKKAQDAPLQDLASKTDIAALRSEMREMEYRIIIRLGGLMIAGFSALGVLMKLN